MKPLFLLFFSPLLIHASAKAPDCRVKKFKPLPAPEAVSEQYRNGTCPGDWLPVTGHWYDSSWKGQFKTKKNGAGITLWWQNLLENPDCVKSVRIFLDGELAKDLERPGSKQKKIQIPYIRPKCRIHSVLLTVEVDTNGRLRCYQASIAVTHNPRDKRDCKEETSGVQNRLPISEESTNKSSTTSESDVTTKPNCTVQREVGNSETSTGTIIACSVIGSGFILILIIGITLWRKKPSSSLMNPPKDIDQNNRIHGTDD